VVAGHKVPGADDDARGCVRPDAGSRGRFRRAVEKSSSKEEVVERVTTRYGDRALPMILDIAAGAAFPE